MSHPDVPEWNPFLLEICQGVVQKYVHSVGGGVSEIFGEYI
jgi:hypothetical protein